MGIPNIFPFTLYATDHHYVVIPELASKLWMRDRRRVAPDLTWYAVDLEVLGHSDVKIHVHQIADSFSGGIGRVIFSYQPVLGEDYLPLLKKIIQQRQTKYALEVHMRRLADEEERRIEALRIELFREEA